MKTRKVYATKALQTWDGRRLEAGDPLEVPEDLAAELTARPDFVATKPRRKPQEEPAAPAAEEG